MEDNNPKFCRNPDSRDPQDAKPVAENDPDSSSSGEETKMVLTAPSPKKRRGVQKRVVSVPIGEVEGSKGKGEGYPPSDSWTWRKYGQKPIKGSPYPRGYYRCSFSKACPARKQVERSCSDPRMLVITYACDHNHPMPTTKGSRPAALSSAPAKATPPTTEHELPDRAAPSEELTTFLSQVDVELTGSPEVLLGDYGWFDDLGRPTLPESSVCLGNSEYLGVDDATRLEHEDEYLFADLDELPESSLIFRHRMLMSDEQNQRCSLSVVTTG